MTSCVLTNDFLHGLQNLFVDLYAVYSCSDNLLKNSLTVKKGAALFKMASVKKVVKSKGVAKKWL